jgi:hypothetical protein
MRSGSLSRCADPREFIKPATLAGFVRPALTGIVDLVLRARIP